MNPRDSHKLGPPGEEMQSSMGEGLVMFMVMGLEDDPSPSKQIKTLKPYRLILLASGSDINI